MKTKQPKQRNCTNFNARQLSRLLTRYYDNELANTGIKITQFSLLAHVQRYGPISPGELAKRMAMDASTMTRNLQPLVTAGYFLNEQGLDLRSRLVSLTPAGQAKLAEADEAWEVAQQNMGAILGTERVANLNSLLGECITLLESSSS